MEVVLGLTVMALLAGTMFLVVQSSIRAATEIETVQKESARVKRFLKLLRETFQTLPAGATLELKLEGQAPLMQELIVRGAPQGLVWGAEPTNSSPFTLAMRYRPESALDPSIPPYFLGISRESFFKRKASANGEPEQEVGSGAMDKILPDEKGRYWMELLPAVESVTWRFYEAEKKFWHEERPAQRPPLVELVLVPKERRIPIRVVFAIP